MGNLSLERALVILIIVVVVVYLLTHLF